MACSKAPMAGADREQELTRSHLLAFVDSQRLDNPSQPRPQLDTLRGLDLSDVLTFVDGGGHEGRRDAILFLWFGRRLLRLTRKK